VGCGFACTPPCILRRALPLSTRWLPVCVTPVNTLTYCRLGSHARAAGAPRRGRLAAVGWLASPGSVWSVLRRYGNINPLSIDYACRPRLRSRLTQGGLTWPWNPWSFGGRVSHPSFATHACILTRVGSTPGSPRRFASHTTLPYPPTPLHAPRGDAWVKRECHGFGGVLEPRYIVGAESLDQ
jgi:hypothetical protein